MTSAAESPRIKANEYLAGEETSPAKHEYLAGEVFAMAGAGETHVTVALNLASMLRDHLRGGPCRVYISDMKVRIEKADAFYYPDVFVTCDPGDAGENLFKRNPTLVIEVLSESTAAFDRGAKFAHYRRLDSLCEYVLVEPELHFVDVFRRNDEGNWVLHPVGKSEQLVLTSVGFRCPMTAVYEDVVLD